MKSICNLPNDPLSQVRRAIAETPLSELEIRILTQLEKERQLENSCLRIMSSVVIHTEAEDGGSEKVGTRPK